MTPHADLRLARLLQLASPALPVGAYSYSQGLEAAVESGIVRDAAGAQRWIADVLEFTVACMEAPAFFRLARAWAANDDAVVALWNARFLAGREAAELRAETVQMGYSLRRLLTDIGVIAPAALLRLDRLFEPAFPTVFVFAVVQWAIAPRDALIAYLWSWLENQVMAALKAVPLGQTDGQRMLFALGATLPGIAEAAELVEDEAIGSFAPGFALACSRHETQYSRLFRS